MALPSFIQVIEPSLGTGTNNIYNATISAAGNSGKIVIGANHIIRIAASAAINVRFGAQATITAAGATDILVPANSPELFDPGYLNDAIWIFSTPGASVTVTGISKN